MSYDTTSYIRADRLTNVDTLVGDDGGTARVYDVTLHEFCVEVVTEFGTLYYAPDDELEVEG